MTSQTDFNIHEQTQSLADAIVELQYELQPELWKPYDSLSRIKSVRDTRYHLEYLFEALDANMPELFVAYLSWVKILFDGLGFPDSVLPRTLGCIRRVLTARLPLELLPPILDILEEGRCSLEKAPVPVLATWVIRRLFWILGGIFHPTILLFCPAWARLFFEYSP